MGMAPTRLGPVYIPRSVSATDGGGRSRTLGAVHDDEHSGWGDSERVAYVDEADRQPEHQI